MWRLVELRSLSFFQSSSFSAPRNLVRTTTTLRQHRTKCTLKLGRNITSRLLCRAQELECSDRQLLKAILSFSDSGR
jgi:hypothetical protein